MKFKDEFNSSEKLDEGLLTGLVGTTLGVLGLIGSIATQSPILLAGASALIVGGIIEALTSNGDVFNNGGKSDGVVLQAIKKHIEGYKNKKFAQGLDEKSAAKILADVEKRKSKLSGGERGSITRLQNKLDRAFQQGDEKEIGKIIQKFIKDN